MDAQPPKWADRFLNWYCNPELLEEIQGDAQELYFERLEEEGKIRADWKYTFDIIRFCRWSNIHRTNEHQKPGYLDILWNLNFKIALRNALNNKVIFSIKMLSLSVCLAFALILSAFIIHEFTFDRHFADYDRIFRVGAKVEMPSGVTNYAVSPTALAAALVEEVPEVENAGWYMSYLSKGKPAFIVGNNTYISEICLGVNPSFLGTLGFDFIRGNGQALDESHAMVLTESSAKKFFGDHDPIGQMISLNNRNWGELEVTGIIKDQPKNSHLQFDVLFSADTYDIYDEWENVNAYTYFKIKEEANIGAVNSKIAAVVNNHREEIEAGREWYHDDAIKVEPIIENITDIHLSYAKDEDVAQKRDVGNLYILAGVVSLFFIIGLINFLNLSLAELTANLKKIGILQVFGGRIANHGKVAIANSILSFLTVIPITLLFCFLGLWSAESYLSIHIERSVFSSFLFTIELVVLVLLLSSLSKISPFVLSRSNNVINVLKGKLGSIQKGLQLREFLVGTQLSFSIVMIALIIIVVDQFQHVNSIDKGFDDKNTIVLKLRYGDFSTAEVFTSSVRKLSGVKNVDASSFYLDNIETSDFFEVDVEGTPLKKFVAYANWGYDYLDVLNIKLVQGRNFDKEHSTDQQKAYLVNEAAVKAFGWEKPIGQRISGPGTDYKGDGTVIGVVKDFNFASLHDDIEPLLISLMNENWGVPYVYIKFDPVRPGDLIAQIENEFHQVYSEMPFDWEYLDSKYASLYKEDYEIRDIFQVGLIISILVSCLGIFSMSALLVILRAKEMGIRKIVGADQIQLFGLHIKNFLKFTVIALIVAYPIIYYLSNYWLDNFAYRIDLSMWYFVFPSLLTLLIILVTSGFHGIKNSQVNPIDTLKHE